MPKKTLPYPDDLPPLSVGTLRVEVTEGPDAGKATTAQSETLTVGTADGNDAVLTDETVSRYHLELERRDDGVLVRDHGSTNGTFSGPVRIQEAIIPPGTPLRIGRSELRVVEGSVVPVPLHQDDRLGDLRGRSRSMRRLMARIEKVAGTDAPVLVVGESGTGKELVARAVHDLSARSQKPFVTVDCGALAPNLVASELFGHERGAFTGADRQHAGAFERAHGGTVFLDEVGELPRDLQPTLLGALERRNFRRVGGREEIRVDVRIVAATNRDLRAEVNKGTFRLDLFYRLAVVMLSLPPLRDRPEDVALLIEHFLSECGHLGGRASLFADDVLQQLAAHHWPGNVRELRNLVEATLAMGEVPTDSLMPGLEPSHEDTIPLGGILGQPYKDARQHVLNEFETRYVRHWLDLTDGNVARAAREARMDRSYLFHLIKRHRLKD
ncbi:MAG: sigma 54-dependent Fis family transcriptional regulator [Myxococcota bacterium]